MDMKEAHEKGIEAASFQIESLSQDFRYGDIGEKRYAEKVIKAYLDASGMVMVPREPTELMISEGESGASIGIGRCTDEESIPRVWRMMLSRSPNPFQTPEESREKK